ncbi:MAG: YbhB/YbcL family Raf kinase inhibitor-like protein [Firmicutes bacterium]|nr:YbhB/YbcL family Raf kinase inhibitor-like protein [Bacillota bacterium]
MMDLKKIITVLVGVLLVWNMNIRIEGEELPDMKFQLKSAAFRHGENIPELYSRTNKGKNLSPPLSWNNPPNGTKSFALIVEDPDIPLFGSFSHWVIYNIPAETSELKEGISSWEKFPNGTIQGKNGYRRTGYVGPHPPWGKHRYIFKIYALDTILKSSPILTRKTLLQAIEGHILAQAELIGCYERK